jgi:hypothetical protein
MRILEMSDRPKPMNANVNVTLATGPTAPSRTFPCPLCAAGLELRQSRANKPYAVCNPCGIQIFFRGKTGIARLQMFLDRDESHTPIAPAAPAVVAFNRLEQLRAQKNELEQKRPLIFADKDLENAISAINAEIAASSNRARSDREQVRALMISREHAHTHMRAALYARVSTAAGQDPEMQLRELRDYCLRRRWDIVGEFVDAGFSGATQKRPQLERLLA